MFTKMRKWFFTGLLVTAPVAITFYLIWFVIKTTDQLTDLILPQGLADTLHIPGFGLLMALAIVIAIGAFASNYFGRIMFGWWDWLIHKLPFVNAVYGSIKQVLQSVFSDQGKSFKEVVYVEFPTADHWALGFVIAELPSILDPAKKMVRVFVPFVPIPTTGMMLHIPVEKIRRSDLSVEEGLKLTVTMGLVGESPSAQ